MIQIFKKTEKETELRTLDHLEVGSWVNAVAPTAHELDALAERCELSRDLLEDSADPHELPRVEQENGTLYVYIRVPVERHGKIDTRPLTIITTGSYLVTISLHDTPILNRFVAKRLDVFTTEKSKFLIYVFNEIVRAFYLHIKAIAKSVSRQRVQLRQLRNRDIVNLVEHEEVLNDFNASLLSNVAVYERIASGKVVPLVEHDQDLIQDLLVDANQVLKFCQESIHSITNIREAYSTILSNNLNKTLKFLTSMTVILTVPLLVSSIYGMNVRLPYADDQNAFNLIAALMVISSLGTFGVFVWRKWL